MPATRDVEFYEKLGRNLRNARVMAGLSQEELGDALNVSFQQIQKYEHAMNRTPIHSLCIISKLTGVPLLNLIGVEDFTMSEQKKHARDFVRYYLSLPPSKQAILEGMARDLNKL